MKQQYSRTCCTFLWSRAYGSELDSPLQLDTVSWEVPRPHAEDSSSVQHSSDILRWWIPTETTCSKDRMWANSSLISNLFPFLLTIIIPSSQVHLYKFTTSFIPSKIFFRNRINLLGTEAYVSELNIPRLNLKYRGETIISEIQLVLPFFHCAILPCPHTTIRYQCSSNNDRRWFCTSGQASVPGHLHTCSH